MMIGSLMNARSAINERRSEEIEDYISENHLDLLAVTETWANPGRDGYNDLRQFCCPTAFAVKHHQPRYRERGGGVALLYRKNIISVIRSRSSSQDSTFEYLDLDLEIRNRTIRLIIEYRPPGSIPDFLDEFDPFIERIKRRTPIHLLILGDFNIHVDNKRNSASRQFQDLIDDAGLKQHVRNPTHKDGHTLDLVLTYSDESFVSNLTVRRFYIGDHRPVEFDLF